MKRRLAFVVGALLFCVCKANATRRDIGPKGLEAVTHFSAFRYGNSWNSGEIRDDELATLIRDFCPARNVDLLVSVCYAGGYLKSFQDRQVLSNGNPRYDTFTFTSSTYWGGMTWTQQGNWGFAGGELPSTEIASSENFIAAWYDDIRSNSDPSIAGMLRHFDAATLGRDTLPETPLVRPVRRDTIQLATDNKRGFPQYWSPDLLDSGPSNTHTLRNDAAAKQYAVMVIGKRADTFGQLDVTRIYRVLRDVYGVPESQIVVLSPDHDAGQRLRCFPQGARRRTKDLAQPDGRPGIVGVWEAPPNDSHCDWDSVYVNARLSAQSLKDAVKGQLFTPSGGNVPRPGDKVLFFLSTHGKQYEYLPPEVASKVTFPPRGFSASGDVVVDGDTLYSQEYDIVDGQKSVLLQISTRRSVQTPSWRVKINGIEEGATPALVADSTRIPIEAAVNEPTIAYQLRVPFDDVALGDSVEVEFVGLTDPDPNHDLIAAVALQGGIQESVGVIQAAPPVPLLGPPGFLLASLFILAAGGWTLRRRESAAYT